jgi:DnaJ-domain-containing protein 1
MPFLFSVFAVLCMVILAPVPVLLGSVLAYFSTVATTSRRINNLFRSGRFASVLKIAVGREGYSIAVDRAGLAKVFPPHGGALLPSVAGCATIFLVVYFVPWASWWNEQVLRPLAGFSASPAISNTIAVLVGTPAVLAVATQASIASRRPQVIEKEIEKRAAILSELVGPKLVEIISNASEIDQICARLAKRRGAVQDAELHLRMFISRGLAGAIDHRLPMADLDGLLEASRCSLVEIRRAGVVYAHTVDRYRAAQGVVDAADSARLRDRLDDCFEGLQSDQLSDLLFRAKIDEYIAVVEHMMKEIESIHAEALNKLKDSAEDTAASSGGRQQSPFRRKLSAEDAYLVLRLSPTATAEQIKSTYRKLTKIYHPDGSGGGVNEDFIKELNEAYDILKRHIGF